VRRRGPVNHEAAFRFHNDDPIISLSRFAGNIPLPHVSQNRFGRAFERIAEAPAAGLVEAEDVALLVNGTISTMRALKVLAGDPRPIQNPVWLDRVVDVLADGPGIWYPLVKRGTYVREGMKIGFVTDYFGKVILEARAPVSGVILHINAVPSLKKGDNIADIGTIATDAP